MKQLFCLTLILFLTACSSGSFSKGVKKDLNTGLTSNYNGFAVENIYLTDDKGNRLSSNKVTLGNALLVVASGVENFKLADGRAYPGCTIILTDKNKKELLNLQDAFAELKDGLPPEQATELKATLTTGAPMQAGETYQLYVHFYDKKNTTSAITSTVELVVK
jgi:hypothetical protein